jgi:uncharacterized protein YndB with AHSA1/START domain
VLIEITAVISFETSLRIARPADEVFELLSDPLKFPQWNSAVRAVTRVSDSIYEMLRDLPGGEARNSLEILSSVAPTEFDIRAGDGPTPFLYRDRLESEPGATVVSLDAEVDLGRRAELLGPIATRAVRRGVEANLETLKRIVEAGD